MRIGVYGGAFDPPHLGHIAAARWVSALLRLDKLLMIPTGHPPHKQLPPHRPTAEQRLELCRLAAGPIGAEVLDLELRRPGTSYTADTLAQLRASYPDAELWLLMGADMFLTLQDWYAAEQILSLAGIAAFGRTREDDADASFSRQRELLYRLCPQTRIFTTAVPEVVDVSSTELRAQLAQGAGGTLLDPAVYGYILREGLYGTAEDLTRLTLEKLRPVALSYLKPRRVPHVLGTEQEAIHLALRYGADVEKARRAALLHDCTKKLDLPEQLVLAERYGVELDIMERETLKLLHAKTGAAIARSVFGEDDEICGAICWHTTGRAGMGLLEKILYLADYIEPTRDFPGVETLRRVCYEDLDRGLLMGLEMTIQEMTALGSPVHRATLQARDALKG